MIKIKLLKSKLTFPLKISCIIILILISFNNTNAKSGNNSQLKDTITVSVVGDLMCHSPQFDYARVEKDSFDFNPVYREIKKYFSETDFLFGNLETVTVGNKIKFSGYPFFNTPDEFISALSNA